MRIARRLGFGRTQLRRARIWARCSTNVAILRGRGALMRTPWLGLRISRGRYGTWRCCAEREGNAEGAERAFEKLVAAKPDWEDAAFRLGFLQLQRGEFAGAVDSFEICLKKRRDWVEALLNLGLACWKFEDLETASETFNRVLSLQPQNRMRYAH